MRFEERDLQPHDEPLSLADLKEGQVYYSLRYADDALLIPIMRTVVFIGRNLESGDSGQVYFQDIDSHREGTRYGDTTNELPARFFASAEHETRHIFDYDHALESLMRCSLRRKSLGL